MTHKTQANTPYVYCFIIVKGVTYIQLPDFQVGTWPPDLFLFLFLEINLFYLAMPGLSCGMQDL